MGSMCPTFCEPAARSQVTSVLKTNIGCTYAVWAVSWDSRIVCHGVFEHYSFQTFSKWFQLHSDLVFLPVKCTEAFPSSRSSWSREMLLLQRRFAELETKRWSLGRAREVVSDLWVPPPAKRSGVRSLCRCAFPEHQSSTATTTSSAKRTSTCTAVSEC